MSFSDIDVEVIRISPVVKICNKQKKQLVAEVVLKACRKSGMVLSD